MNQSEDQFNRSNIGDKIKNNIKYLIGNQTQKEFAEMIGIQQSTLTGYLKGPKITGILDFLIELKKRFPEYTIDQILFNDLSHITISDESSQIILTNSDINKFYGTYYIYYLDTSKKSLLFANKHTEISAPSSSPELKYGVISISADEIDQSYSKAKCIAVLGLSEETDAIELYEKFNLLENYMQIYKLIQNTSSNKLYTGKLNISHDNIFIQLDRYTASRDSLMIILHHADISNLYFGGLGTINSVSGGNYSDPIVQLIALSRNPASYLGTEQIKTTLRFSVLQQDKNSLPEEEKLVDFIRNTYGQNNSLPYSDPLHLTEENIEIIIKSYLKSLIEDVLRRNILCFGRVTREDDDIWYHLLKDSETYQRQLKEEIHDTDSEDSPTNYKLY